MRHEAKCHDPHQTLAGEDHREDHFDFFQELVDSVCISVRQWSEDLNKKVRVALIKSETVFNQALTGSTKQTITIKENSRQFAKLCNNRIHYS